MSRQEPKRAQTLATGARPPLLCPGLVPTACEVVAAARAAKAFCFGPPSRRRMCAEEPAAQKLLHAYLGPVSWKSSTETAEPVPDEPMPPVPEPEPEPMAAP